MKKFYLDGTEIKVEISPTLVETLDESLDNMTLSLAINQDATPLEPLKHKIQVYDNTTLMNEFLISSDNVELVGVNPARYKHTVSLIQNSQRLTKNLIRNNVFSTSISSFLSSYIFGGAFWFACNRAQNYRRGLYYSKNTLSLDLSKTHIEDLYIKPDFLVFYRESFFSFITIDDYYPLARHITKRYVVNQDTSANKWSDVYKNSPSDVDYPTIVFQIGGETKNWKLTDFRNNVPIKVPTEILNWIKTFSSGTLNISANELINTNASGFDWSQDTTVNSPIFGKLIFSLEGAVSIDRSVYEVIEELIKQYRKDTKLYHDAVDLFKMPDSTHHKDLYDLLTNTSSPNFAFTQASMFDALAEIFRLFDATFRIDKDGYLDIEYFNERATDKKFELIDSLKAGRSSALGEERYANRLLTYFQNTKVDDKFPNSNNDKATAYLRSKTLGVPGISDFVFIVPKPIDILNKVYIENNQNLVNVNFDLYDDEWRIQDNEYAMQEIMFSSSFTSLIDITSNVVEEEIWSNLPTTGAMTPSTTTLYKQNTLYYKRGTNYIEISNYYNITDPIAAFNNKKAVIDNLFLTVASLKKNLGLMGTTQSGSYVPSAKVNPGTTSWQNLKLKVDYIALTDGKLINESINNKYDGEILTNQNNGSIDINKLGLNMVGLSLKLGQPTLTITQSFTSWENRIKKGQWFVQNGETWVANNCSYTLVDNEHVQATIEFVKDFNGLASRIELNREKRLSNISNDLTTKCEENYGEFIYYCDTVSPSQAGEEIALKDQFLRNTLSLGFGKKLMDANISTSYNASSLVIQETLNSSLDLTQYTKKNLIRLSGYVGDGVESDNPGGNIVLWENNDQTGKSIEIPISGAAKASIYLNDITREFEVDYYYLSTIDFNQVDPTMYIEDGDNLEVCLIVDKGTILGAVILDDLNTSGLTGWYDPSSIILRYPENDYRIEYALLTALNEDNSIISLEETGQVKNIAVPMVVYGSGNSICFEMSFESPISAGTQLLNNYTSSIWSDGWFSRHVLYTNEDGEAPKFTIDFVKMQEELTRYFPAMKKSDNNDFLETYSFGKLEEFAYYKKPNEIFALNYQLHFLPYVPTGKKQTFLSNEYIKNNGFANGLNNKLLHIIYTSEEDEDDFEYSILDTKGYGEHTTNFSIPNLQFQDSHKFQIRFDTQLTNAELDKIKTWAIVDERNNIYFASNNTPGSNGFNITFIFRHHRI